MNLLEKFTNLYSISKTLRFELRPIGNTLQKIRTSGLLEQDEQRAEKYKLAKKIIDEYHKDFIEKALCDFKLKIDDDDGKDSLSEYFSYYKIGKKDDAQKKIFADIQGKLRKQITKQLTSNEIYKRIDKKELIKEDLLKFVKTTDELATISEFNNFTTYFTGFHTNRQNMYSDEEKSTAIAFRLIHENLPKFIDNMTTFERVAQSSVADNFTNLYAELEEYLNVLHIKNMFQLSYFNETLTQKQIDVYNMVIGGKALENGTKLKGLNEYINLYNQQQKDKNQRLPKLKPLFKQILSDRVTLSWLPDEFESDYETLKNIKTYYQEMHQEVLYREVKGEYSLLELLRNLPEYHLDNIYIRNDLQLTDISQKIFGDWGEITKAIEEYYKTQIPQIKRQSDEQYETIIANKVKSADSFSIGFINACLLLVGKEKRLEDYFRSLGALQPEANNNPTLIELIEQSYREAETLLNTDYPAENNLSQEKADVEKIKNLLDAIKNLQHFVKPLVGKGDEPDKDERFYGEFTVLWEHLDKITPLYNKVRNRMTRKPYSEEKFKLNFENSTLLDGWDLNKESDNTSVILRKDGLYYLGIMNKKHNKVFRADNIKSDGVCYEKMEYKLLPGANKMLPKVFFSKSRIDEFAPSTAIIDNYKNDTHKKGDTFNLNDCHNLIDFFKASIKKHEDWKHFEHQFSPTESYKDLSGFYREVEQQGYKITFRKVSGTYINKLVDEGKLYLFQIYNKDFSPYSKGTPNMHTLYWKMLFDENNLRDVVYKLNGQAEVFFRKSSINEKNRVIHKKNEVINNKNEDTKQRKPTSIFEYDIVKDYRYTVDKFQFHVPITMNFKTVGLNNINSEVNQFLQEADNLHIIGIDRGERHLLYLTVVDMQGNIKEQYSLNEIVNNYNGNVYRTNYKDLLQKREDERDKERKSWKTIENIKELKEGYLSQVIHKITQLMIKYNAIVVLEDLNLGFMRGRQKVEKQVYQKFEKMLIDKLNYLVFKNKATTETGGLLKAYQLTNKFESFQKMGKQNGFLFYIPAWNTSKIDPVTGFVNMFDASYINLEKAKSFFNNFETITFNAKGWFEFEVSDYKKFNPKTIETRTEWTICTYGNRIETYRNATKNNQWDNREVNLTEEFKKLFEKYNISLNNDLKAEILSQTEKAFFERMLYLFRLTVQMRNSETNTEKDYMISPIADENGNFYNSDTEKNKGKDENGNWISQLPVDADANGAYNIARKGLILIEKIKQSEKLDKLDLFITNKEWLQFAQKQNK